MTNFYSFPTVSLTTASAKTTVSVSPAEVSKADYTYTCDVTYDLKDFPTPILTLVEDTTDKTRKWEIDAAKNDNNFDTFINKNLISMAAAVAFNPSYPTVSAIPAGAGNNQLISLIEVSGDTIKTTDVTNTIDSPYSFNFSKTPSILGKLYLGFIVAMLQTIGASSSHLTDIDNSFPRITNWDAFHEEFVTKFESAFSSYTTTYLTDVDDVINMIGRTKWGATSDPSTTDEIAMIETTDVWEIPLHITWTGGSGASVLKVIMRIKFTDSTPAV